MLSVLVTKSTLHVREAVDADGEGLIDVVGSCYAEYPGCILDVDGEVPELRAIASFYGLHRGRFWVVENGEGALVASVGCLPARDGNGLELQKLYVARTVRRDGLGRRLCERVEEEAIRSGCEFVELWVDARFKAAHRLYERLGYGRSETMRKLRDRSRSIEYHYRKDL